MEPRESVSPSSAQRVCAVHGPNFTVAVFESRRDELLAYHRRHSPAKSENGRLLFFVSQAGRLQCQNGAYLSEVDSELAQILFGESLDGAIVDGEGLTDLVTGEQAGGILSRIGQEQFSRSVRQNYGGQCCFPECKVDDRELLVAAHIARWADAPKLRGSIANGFCFCALHDRAFEAGYFTVTADGTVFVDPERGTEQQMGE